MPFNFPLYNFGNQMYQPDTRIFDMISGMLGNIPQRRDDQGILQRILAGIVGAGSGGGPSAVVGGQPIGFQFDANKGLLAQDKFMNPGYYSDLENYNNKLKILSPMLENEQQQNVNKRILFDQNEDRKIRQQQADRQEARDIQIKEKENAQLELAKKKQETADRLAQARIYKLEHPDMKPFVDDNGFVVFANPQDPTKIVQTQIQTGEMDDLQKAQFDLQGDLRKLQEQHRNTLSEIAARGAEARTTKSTPGSSTTTTDELPTQTRVRIINRTKQFKAENPTLAKWVDDEGNIKEPTRSTLGGMWNTSGPTQVEYNKIKNYIYGEPVAPKRETVKVPNANGVANTGKVKMIDPQGKAWMIDPSGVNEAIKRGWKRG